MLEETNRLEALRLAVATANSNDTTSDIVTRAKIFYAFIEDGGTKSEE